MTRVRLLLLVCAVCATGCSNSEEIAKLKTDLVRVQNDAQGAKAELAKVQGQLDAAAKEAKAPPKWEYKIVEGLIGPQLLTQLGDEGWEAIPVPYFPAIIYPANIDPKTGNVGMGRIDPLTGQTIRLETTVTPTILFKRRKVVAAAP